MVDPLRLVHRTHLVESVADEFPHHRAGAEVDGGSTRQTASTMEVQVAENESVTVTSMVTSNVHDHHRTIRGEEDVHRAVLEVHQ